MGRRRVRSRHVGAVRQRERDGVDREPGAACATGGGDERQRAVRDALRGLSRRRPEGDTTGLPVAARSDGPPHDARDPCRPLGWERADAGVRAARFGRFIGHPALHPHGGAGPGSGGHDRGLADRPEVPPPNRQVSRPRWLSGHQTALGHAERDRPKYGQVSLEDPAGEYRELAAQGITNTGCENYGGPVVTAGGVLFIGATNYDSKFRAFDKATGAPLWETMLPAPGNATPATYEVKGRQFGVIAASSRT